MRTPFKTLSLALLLLSLAPKAHAIDPSEVIITAQAAFEKPLGPDRYLQDYYGGGAFFMLEKALSTRYSVGAGLSQVAFRSTDGRNAVMGSLDVVGRRYFNKWGSLNPYFLVGIGGNLFKDSFKDVYGDIFHAQFALGSLYVLDKRWALDYALDYHVMAPLNTPHHFIGARLGLSYRFGTQPKVNQIAPPPVLASGVETLSEAKVQQVVGKVAYTVQPGDSLYRIAGRPQLLGRPILWPLVADNNAAEIKDPHLIQPGQVLEIRRNYTNDQAEKARKVATKTVYTRPTAQK